jgi:hypothetical protein
MDPDPRAYRAHGELGARIPTVSRDPRDLRRLAQELAALSPEERARVIAEANRARLRPLPKGFTPPVLSGGTRWIGGDLLREDLYGDDGR